MLRRSDVGGVMAVWQVIEGIWMQAKAKVKRDVGLEGRKSS